MAYTLVLIAVSVALSYLAQRYLAPDAENPLVDDTPTTLATRGSFVPIVLGTRRTGPVFCFAGGRRTVEESIGGGGGKGGSPDGPTSLTYFEQGFHAICVGPATKLIQVRAGSTNQIAAEILAATSPSGTGHSSGSTGNFRFYFGECTQPVEANYASLVGIASRFPQLCFAYWNDRVLGSGPTWPNIDYEIQVQPTPESLILTDSAGWLDDGTSSGWNPAHAIYQLLTASFPHGSGVDPASLDLTRFQQLGVLLENEHLPINIIGRSGMSLAKLLADMMQDIGLAIPQVGDLLTPWLVRETYAPFDEVIPRWDASILQTPLQEQIIKDISRPSASRMLFQFPYNDNRYRKYDMVIDYDANAAVNARVETAKVDIPSITHIDVANKVVARRQVEMLTDQRVLRGKFMRDARLINSGQRFDLLGSGRFRVMSIKRLADDGACELEYMADPFGDVPSTFVPESPVPVDQIPDRNSAIPAADDLAFDFFEPPCTFARSVVPLIFGVRARDNVDISGSNAWLSTMDVTYSQIGSAGPNMNTGLLTEALDLTDNVIVESGPIVDLESVDVAAISDLTADSDSWLTGSQNLLINDEWFFLQSVTALGGTLYQLNGLARARHDTKQGVHSIGARIWIFKTQNVELLGGSVVIGQSIFYKSVPFNDTQVADITGITPVNKQIVGRTLNPLSVTGLRTGNVLTDARGNVFVAAADTVIDWNYRVCNGAGVALGEQVAGTILSTTDLPSDGPATLEILDSGDVVVRTVAIANDAATYTYTTANRTADFGGEPALFKVRVTQHDSTGARSADAVTITIVQEF